MQRRDYFKSIACYYLLYKLQNSPTLWIVKTETNKIPLLDHINKFKSKTEKYYIIKKYVTDIDKELDTKRFSTFKHSTDSYIIAETY